MIREAFIKYLSIYDNSLILSPYIMLKRKLSIQKSNIIENTFYSPILELYWKLFKAQRINPENIFKKHHINIKELKATDKHIKSSVVDAL